MSCTINAVRGPDFGPQIPSWSGAAAHDASTYPSADPPQPGRRWLTKERMSALLEAYLAQDPSQNDIDYVLRPLERVILTQMLRRGPSASGNHGGPRTQSGNGKSPRH